MTHYLWFAAIPVWIFLWVAIWTWVLRFTIDQHRYEWWSLPLWMAVWVPTAIITIGGITWLGGKGSGML